MTNATTNDFTIEFSDEYGWYSVYEFGVFPRSSVLAGQTMKTHRGSFDTVEEALHFVGVRAPAGQLCSMSRITYYF